MAAVGYAVLPFLVFAVSMVLFLRMMHDIGTRAQPMRRNVVPPRPGQARQPSTASNATRFKA
jgi:hypothetical protein